MRQIVLFACLALASPVVVTASVTANAGADQTAADARSVSLSAAGSSGSGETITAYLWTQTVGTSVSISGATTATPSFTSPTLSTDNATLSFQLTVTGSLGGTSNDSVTIWVVNTDANDIVQISDANISRLIQPQLMSGSVNNPWPWFDTNAISSGLTAGREFPSYPPSISLTGTAAVTNGSATVTFTGGALGSEVIAGWDLYLNTTGTTWEGPFSISTVGASTLTLSSAWTGSTVSGRTASVIRPGFLGTASVTNGSAIVTFSGSNLTGEMGSDNRLYLKISGTWTGPYEVASIDSATQLTLSSNWTGSTASGLFPSTGGGFDTGNGAEIELYFGYWNYYDQSLTQRINYYRTGNPEFLTISRKIADSWWLYHSSGKWRNFENINPPRQAALKGLILRAIDEGDTSTKWDWLAEFVDTMYPTWLGLRIADSDLYYGVRDGSYALMFVAELSQVLPNTYPNYGGGNITDGATRRATYKTNLANVVNNYYYRLQTTTAGVKHGAWLWADPDWWVGNGQLSFHVGLLHEALLYIYECYKDDGTMATMIANIKTAIINSAENLYENQWVSAAVSGYSPATNWRSMQYERHSTTTPNLETPTYTGDANDIRNQRQQSSTLHQAFGYAWLFSGDSKFKTYGDDVFSSSFGNSLGPGADTRYDLSDFITPGGNRRMKEYNESYRASGTYLVERLLSPLSGSTPSVRGWIEVKGRLPVRP